MEAETISALKELGIGMFSVGVVGYILYQVILSLRDEHKENQEWFKGYVNENNHRTTDLVSEVSKNIALNTASNQKFIETLENHTKVVEKLVDKLSK
jgi:hypothetical protein